MSDIEIRDMQDSDEPYLSTCSHVDESREIDAQAAKRRSVLHGLARHGARFKIVLDGPDHAGFAHGLPIDRSPWGPLGENLMVIPCLYVRRESTGRGAGRALVGSIERDARQASFAGVTVTAYRDIPGAEWFMPAAYFEQLGYRPVAERGREALLWKPFRAGAAPPRFLEPRYTFEPIDGVCVVDLFWNDFCPTSGIEAQRVREVCAAFGDRVVLHEYCADDRDTFLRYRIPRRITVDGQEIWWGYEAPRDGIRSAIERALSSRST